jgi:predicted nuclease of predicted toxin-antitoxin system
VAAADGEAQNGAGAFGRFLMAFLIDECLHTSLIEIAHAAGHEAHHVVYLGMQGWKDHELLVQVRERDYTLVTNNAVDFRRLYQHLPVHAGLIILLPNLIPALQRKLFQAALDEIGAGDLIDEVLEVDLEGGEIVLQRYDMPAT